MIVLIFSGCIIHFPFIPGIMGVCRGLHIFFGFVLFINCLVRVILAFVVESAPTAGTRKTVRTTRPGCRRPTISTRVPSGSSTTCSCVRPIRCRQSSACLRRFPTC
ncbi:cytochrome b/b6 domain-containing protein [Slackia heliotrinireducens]|uniref:cytochrome b/b6 domain-containing protein n=1 Tax=Slackia heliotrinireducens TaxID=84110 RepID=UPI0020B63E40|nr:cytochrome b/b6 domain-containing protein [Slackia heliotrinireducens]